jgi:hypothetical protein
MDNPKDSGTSLVYINAITNANIILWGTPIIDGYKLQVSDKILVKDQIDPEENGIYIVSYDKWDKMCITTPTLICLNDTDGKHKFDDVKKYPICFNNTLIPKKY